MSIATRTGDTGTTALLFGRRVPKTHPRLEAYGTVDELSAVLGLVRVSARQSFVKETVLRVQKELIQMGAELATDDEDLKKMASAQIYGIQDEHLARLDELVASYEARLPKPKGFVQAGSSIQTAYLHQARTVCRRAERAVWHLREKGGHVSDLVPQYLNRLADVLWLMAWEEEVWET